MNSTDAALSTAGAITDNSPKIILIAIVVLCLVLVLLKLGKDKKNGTGGYAEGKNKKNKF